MSDFRFQVPPRQYDPGYFSRFVRDLQIALNSIEATGPESFTAINLVRTATNGNGLPVGTVFTNGGVLTIVLAGVAYPGSQRAVGNVGTVTVVIS